MCSTATRTSVLKKVRENGTWEKRLLLGKQEKNVFVFRRYRAIQLDVTFVRVHHNIAASIFNATIANYKCKR